MGKARNNKHASSALVRNGRVLVGGGTVNDTVLFTTIRWSPASSRIPRDNLMLVRSFAKRMVESENESWGSLSSVNVQART